MATNGRNGRTDFGAELYYRVLERLLHRLDRV
jgi:hypothetical protein